MSGVEHQVLELVAFVHKEMVDTHLTEVHHIVRAVLDGVGYLLQLHFQVELAFLQSLEHRTGDVFALRTQHLQVFLHRIKLCLQYALLQLR